MTLKHFQIFFSTGIVCPDIGKTRSVKKYALLNYTHSQNIFSKNTLWKRTTFEKCTLEIYTFEKRFLKYIISKEIIQRSSMQILYKELLESA